MRFEEDNLQSGSNEDELIDSIWHKTEEQKRTQKGVTLFFVHLLGCGMFYINQKKERKYIYSIFALFAWLSFINVFVKLIPAMEQFQNRTLIGAYTIIVSWFIVYIIGYFDVYREFYRKTKKEDF